MKIAIISDQVDQDLNTACMKIKQQGYKFVELHNVFHKSIEECNENEVEKIKEILNKYELKVVNLASTIFFLCPLKENYKVSLFNPEFHAIEGNVETHLKYLEKACKIANQLDCASVRIFPFRFPDNEDVIVVGTYEDQQLIINNFKRALEIAEKYNITLMVENCPYSHCPKGEMTYQIVKAINHKNIKMLWDPANSYRAEKHKVPKEYQSLSLNEEFDLIKDEIGHVHLKNYTYQADLDKPFVHKSLLAGDIDYNELFSKMNHHLTKVYYSLEPEVDFEDVILSMKELKGWK